jgi:hypothetical protein
MRKPLKQDEHAGRVSHGRNPPFFVCKRPITLTLIRAASSSCLSDLSIVGFVFDADQSGQLPFAR